MKTCQYYKGTEQVGADSTRILCSYMASGGKVFKNNDPESAARMQFRMTRTKMLTESNSTKVKSFRCLRTDSAR